MNTDDQKKISEMNLYQDYLISIYNKLPKELRDKDEFHRIYQYLKGLKPITSMEEFEGRKVVLELNASYLNNLRIDMNLNF